MNLKTIEDIAKMPKGSWGKHVKNHERHKLFSLLILCNKTFGIGFAFSKPYSVVTNDYKLKYLCLDVKIYLLNLLVCVSLPIWIKKYGIDLHTTIQDCKGSET